MSERARTLLVFLAIALPVPLIAGSGLVVPVPSLIGKLAASLVSQGSAGPATTPMRTGDIVLTSAELSQDAERDTTGETGILAAAPADGAQSAEGRSRIEPEPVRNGGDDGVLDLAPGTAPGPPRPGDPGGGDDPLRAVSSPAAPDNSGGDHTERPTTTGSKPPKEPEPDSPDRSPSKGDPTVATAPDANAPEPDGTPTTSEPEPGVTEPVTTDPGGAGPTLGGSGDETAHAQQGRRCPGGEGHAAGRGDARQQGRRRPGGEGHAAGRGDARTGERGGRRPVALTAERQREPPGECVYRP